MIQMTVMIDSISCNSIKATHDFKAKKLLFLGNS